MKRKLLNQRLLNKRGAIETQVFEFWVEYIILFFLLLGFLLAILLRSAFLTYTLALVSGLFAGKVYYEKRKSAPILAPLLIILGFALGFTLGSIRANRLVVLLFFVAAAYFSNHAHKKGWVKYLHVSSFVR